MLCSLKAPGGSWGSWWQLVTATLDNLCWARAFTRFSLCLTKLQRWSYPHLQQVGQAPSQPDLSWSLLSLPALTLTMNHTIPKLACCSGVTWNKTTLHPWTTGDSASASQHLSHGSKPIFRCQSLLLLLGKKNLLNFYRERPAVTPGLDRSQRNTEALVWLDCATTLRKGFVYPSTPPALPKYHTPPRASGHRLVEIGFRLASDQQGPRSALCELTWTPATSLALNCHSICRPISASSEPSSLPLLHLVFPRKEG